MSESKFNLDQQVEKYNSGTSIPVVTAVDIRATLNVLLRCRRAFPDLPMGADMDELDSVCGDGADVFAVLLRSAVILALLERPDREHTAEREERLIQSLAKLDLKATEFDNPNAIEDRAEHECHLE